MSCRIQTIDGPLVIPNAGPEHCENVWGEAFDKKTHIVYAVAVSQKDAISCARNNEYSEYRAMKDSKKQYEDEEEYWANFKGDEGNDGEVF